MVNKVSVHLITYNHENYVAQAIESALTQQVNFDYEIVVGEDCSTDRTRDIVIELAKAHPKRIRLLLRGKNLEGLGKNNFIDTLNACKGEYVALLDGDDYWTSRDKLQRQVDFLESHPDCSLCFHDAIVVNDHGSEHRLYPPDQKEISTLEDLITAGTFPVTSTVLFRNSLLGPLPDSFYRAFNGDWMLDVLLAERGSLGYINEPMSAYRMHDGGVGSRLSEIQRTRSHIESYKTIDAHLNHKYSRVVSEKIAAWRALLAQLSKHEARACLDQYRGLVQKGELTRGLRVLLEAVEYAPLEVFRPRRFAAVVKTGLLGIWHKIGAQN